MSQLQQQTIVGDAQASHFQHTSTTPARCVDLSAEICPMTFVKLKLHMDRISPGELIEVVVKEGEHMVNVPRNLGDEGHKIEAVSREGENYHLLVKKAL